MKYSILIFTTTLLFTYSCQPSENKVQNAASHSVVTNADTLAECFSSSQIYNETAFLWQASWVTYYNQFRNGNYLNSPQINFEENLLNQMNAQVLSEADAGVMIWYVMLSENDSIPSLAVQNTISCIPDTNSIIILAPGNGSANSTISHDDLRTYRTNWRQSSENNLDVFTPIYGYNYSWTSLRTLLDGNSQADGIFINYGLRTIGPEETYYGTSPFTDKTGSVVYCNVLYNSDEEGNPLAFLLDFAMPCPTYCGTF